jgi:hypothetical protein
VQVGCNTFAVGDEGEDGWVFIAPAVIEEIQPVVIFFAVKLYEPDKRLVKIPEVFK